MLEKRREKSALLCLMVTESSRGRRSDVHTGPFCDAIEKYIIFTRRKKTGIFAWNSCVIELRKSMLNWHNRKLQRVSFKRRVQIFGSIISLRRKAPSKKTDLNSIYFFRWFNRLVKGSWPSGKAIGRCNIKARVQIPVRAIFNSKTRLRGCLVGLFTALVVIYRAWLFARQDNSIIG